MNKLLANTLKFLLLLIDRNRIALLDGVAQRYLELSYKQESIEVAKVISSVSIISTTTTKPCGKIENNYWCKANQTCT